MTHAESHDRLGENADEVARAVLTEFGALPAKFKPRIRNETIREWVPLSGIVLSSPSHGLKCVALATGMKCLPREKVPQANGVVLHDSHAEILALRAFNTFLLSECSVVATGQTSTWVEGCQNHDDSHSLPFAVKTDVRIHMYCSEAPCGDASMELIMAEQEDATPWTSTPIFEAGIDTPQQELPLHGRGNFSQLGVVRTKPSRPDAPFTLSKSCSDKLALKQCTSLLNSVTSLLIDPGNCYLQGLVLPESQHVAAATARAFDRSGRMSALTPETTRGWPASYRFKPMDIVTTSHEFEFSKRSIPRDATGIASNLSAMWLPCFQEVLINGTLQGRKQFDPRGASLLSRKRMWEHARDLGNTCVLNGLRIGALESSSYACLKESSVLADRSRVKADARRNALTPWNRNVGDEEFKA